MKKSGLIIGIAGPSAGGKTTVTNKILEQFPEDTITVIKYDDYYKDQSELTMEERVKTNYDHPNAFDTDLLIADLMRLKSGVAIEKPVYDFVEHNRSEQTERIEPGNIIIVEGLFTLLESRIRELLDIKVYVTADSDECFIRRLKRDTVERGRTTESIINQYLNTVKPMKEKFIDPTRKFADVIVLRGGENHVAVQMVTHMISDHISKQGE